MTKARNNADNVSGDISEVTAGTGITVSSGTGPAPAVALTTPVASTNGGTGLSSFTTGDIIYSSSGNTLSKLGIGTTSQVLTVASGLPSWAAPAGGSTFAGASVTKDGTAQSLSNATYTAIVYQTEDYDTDTFHSTSSNTSRFTIPAGKNGKYLFTVVVNFKANATGDRRLAIHKNGNAVLYAVGIVPINGQDTRCGTSVIYNLVATDYIEIFAYQNSGGSLDLAGGSNENQFTITYLGA